MTPRELAAVLGRRTTMRGFDRAALAALMHRFPDPPAVSARDRSTTGVNTDDRHVE